MSNIIDRRYSSKNKSAINRQRFIQRFKKQIKTSVENAISKRSITDIYSGEKIVIPSRDIHEPYFFYGAGGIKEIVLPGNKNFLKGEKIEKSIFNTEKENSASKDGYGEDEFVFYLDKNEFLELFFEDLELPNLVKKDFLSIPEYQWIKAGISKYGAPNKISIIHSMKNALARRVSLRSSYKDRLKSSEEKLKTLQKKDPQNPIIDDLKEKILLIKNKIKRIPFIDKVDLRYKLHVQEKKPNTQAVMFCLMDVSGSMDEMKKDMAKRFFILLYLFLKRHYEAVEIIFIRHHTSAKEVDEEEFFYSKETGGTVVSSALELMIEIIQHRFSSTDWNIYAAQASDGDNWNADSPYCEKLISEHIISYLQYFAYVEIMPRHHQSLWEAYSKLKQQHQNFAMQQVQHLSEIYPVFRELFKKGGK